MISLDQIQLLEQKVESAVAKILQLTEERDAIYRRCIQLEEENNRLQSNILDFHQDQERIEQGIIKALDKLNTVENSVLQAVILQDNNEVKNVIRPVVQDVSSIHKEDNFQLNQSEKIDEHFCESGISAEQQITQTVEEITSPLLSSNEFEEKIELFEEVNHTTNQNYEPLLKSENDNLFAESHDVRNSEQLDIF